MPAAESGVAEAREGADAGGPSLLSQLQLLIELNRAWGAGEPVDLDAAARLRRRVLVLHHHRYLGSIAAYRRMADRFGTGLAWTVGDIAHHMLVTADVFKSYDARWLGAGDFAALTGWLETLFFRPIPAPPGVTTLGEWREALRRREVYVTISSGTSGKPSFVPRDRAALAAQAGNSLSRPGLDLQPGEYDCLVLAPPGRMMGIQAAGSGLAGRAARSHHLHDAAPDADALAGLREAAPGGRRVEAAGRAAAFLRAATLPVLVFGTPAEALDLSVRLRSDPVALPPGSAVVTGGGWKGARPVGRDELLAAISGAFGLGPESVVDAYSASEFSFVLTSCPEGHYHVPPSVEVLALDDLLTPIGGTAATGSLGFLDAFAVSYPGFIATDDRGRVVVGGCPCGLGGPFVAGPITRAPGAEARGCGGTLARALG